jgi:hypothetical protein
MPSYMYPLQMLQVSAALSLLGAGMLAVPAAFIDGLIDSAALTQLLQRGAERAHASALSAAATRDMLTAHLAACRCAPCLQRVVERRSMHACMHVPGRLLVA